MFPGNTMVFCGVVEKLETDEAGCSWAKVALSLTVNEKTMTECAARIAVPVSAEDNPWKRRGTAWKP